jgi:hypothetical protein
MCGCGKLQEDEEEEEEAAAASAEEKKGQARTRKGRGDHGGKGN